MGAAIHRSPLKQKIMVYTKVSIPKRTGGSPGAPSAKKPTIIAINVRDIETWPARDPNGVLLVGNIALKASAKAIGIYATHSTIKRNDGSEGDADAEGFNHNVVFDHPGNSLARDVFAQNNVSEDLILITQGETSIDTRVHGTPTNPMKMVVEEQDDNEANKATFTFKSALRTKYKSAHYRGTLPALADDAPEETGSTGSGI